MKRLEIIDFLKGYSIFTIVIFHYMSELHLHEPFNKFILFGGTGVHLFIFMSGFGLYLSYLNKPISYGSFVKKRFGKIYIPYVLVVLISALISIFIPVYKNSLYAIGGHIFLYKMFDENIVGSYGYPLWFISTIFQFYLMFYLIVYFKKGLNSTWFILISFGISILWGILIVLTGKESERVWNSFFLQYFWEFSLGMLVAAYTARNNFEIPIKLKPLYLLSAGIFCCIIYGALALYLGNIGKIFNDYPALLGYTLIAIWIYQLNIKIINNFFLFTGKISYSFYLLHILILITVSMLMKNFSASMYLITALLLCYLISYYYQGIVNRIYGLLKI
jgi:peptidoglycan/LPS O-acetylase OafA/YrhL